MPSSRTWFASVGMLAVLASSASAQGVAFIPGISSFPNGASMSVTPVVSADRRYVRLTVNPQFTVLEGFTPFIVPAAVTGGGGRGLGGGGVGALGGGGAAGFAGLNGPMNGPGTPMAQGSGPLAGAGLSTTTGPTDSFSGDFEDQVTPRAIAAPSPGPRAATVGPKAKGRRRGQGGKSQRATASASKVRAQKERATASSN